jgi:hypothetical protein
MKKTNKPETIIGDDGEREFLCEHGIGHGNSVHTCDPPRHGNRCPYKELAKRAREYNK